MNHDHPLANNLLARLFSYTPREDRKPIEDFCTETLAWCLRANTRFCKSFLQQFGLDYESDLKIETQLATGGKRLDLAIFSYKKNFLIVLENKVWSTFRGDQLQNYRQIIDQKFSSYETRLLATITPFSTRPNWSDKHFTWSQVQELLAGPEYQSDQEFETVCHWFADFLANQGLKPMKINIQKIPDYFESFKLRQDMEDFLEGLRKTKVLESLLKGKPIFEPDKSNNLWLGVYGNDKTNGYWFGFQMHNTPPEIYTYAQRFLAGDKQRLFEKLKNDAIRGNQLYPDDECIGGCYAHKYNITWIRYRKLLTKDFYTDDKMRDWFAEVAEFMENLDDNK